MNNTKGDVALTITSREKSIFMILCIIQNKSSSPFLILEHVLSMFLKFGPIFQPHL